MTARGMMGEKRFNGNICLSGNLSFDSLGPIWPIIVPKFIASYVWHMEIKFHTQLDESCFHYIWKYYIGVCYHS